MKTQATVRAKFIVTSVTHYAGFKGAKVALTPVNPQHQETSENLAFWEATPNGEITMQITNPQTAEQFKPGDEYYVDFTKVTYSSVAASKEATTPSVSG